MAFASEVSSKAGIAVTAIVDNDDILSSYDLSYYSPLYQGATIYSGALLQTHGYQINGFGSYVGLMYFDVQSHQFDRHIDLSNIVSREPQGVTVYNEKLKCTNLKQQGLILYEGEKVGYVSSGLRQSITHKVVAGEVFIGTNNKAPNGAPYPLYVELGTGIYAANGDGRKSPWTWFDKNGKAHFTHGMKPHHMFRDAISDHKEEYKKTVLKYLKGNG